MIQWSLSTKAPWTASLLMREYYDLLTLQRTTGAAVVRGDVTVGGNHAGSRAMTVKATGGAATIAVEASRVCDGQDPGSDRPMPRWRFRTAPRRAGPHHASLRCATGVRIISVTRLTGPSPVGTSRWVPTRRSGCRSVRLPVRRPHGVFGGNATATVQAPNGVDARLVLSETGARAFL